MNTEIEDCMVEIDHERGVIYVHDGRGRGTLLRICQLNKPIPRDVVSIDITFGVGMSYESGRIREPSGTVQEPYGPLGGSLNPTKPGPDCHAEKAGRDQAHLKFWYCQGHQEFHEIPKEGQ